MMRILSIFILTFALFISNISIAQNTNKKAVVSVAKFSGQAFIATDGKAAYFNMGGPSIKMQFKNVSLGLCILPSLRILKDPLKPDILPLAGAGFMLTYKHLIIGIPTYYVAAENKWKLCAGLGIKIGK
jgi:hypothetical protein